MADPFLARNMEYVHQPHSAQLRHVACGIRHVCHAARLTYVCSACRNKGLTAKVGQTPFIHVARAKSSKNLGPQASCTPADRSRACNNAGMHSMLYTYGMGCSTKASKGMYTLGAHIM